MKLLFKFVDVCSLLVNAASPPKSMSFSSLTLDAAVEASVDVLGKIHKILQSVSEFLSRVCSQNTSKLVQMIKEILMKVQS
jgi:hypothetical protein